VGTLTVTGGARTTFRSVDSDFVGDLVITGAGTILQSAVATPDETIPDASNVTVDTGAIFQLAISLGGSETIAGLNGDGMVRTYPTGSLPGTLIVGFGDANGAFSGVVANGQGALALTKIGAGTQILSGPCTYSGTTTIDDGTLAVTGSLDGNTPITVSAPGVFELGDGSITDDCWISFRPTTNGVTNAVTGDGTATLNDAIAIDLSLAELTDGNSWLLVDVTNLAVSYGANFEVTGFTESSPGVWTTAAYGNTWTFTEATGELGTVVSDYDTWAAANAPGETMDMDHDGDGTENGIEYFMGETGSGFTPHPMIDGSNTVAWTRGASYGGAYGIDYWVETSTDCEIWVPVSDTDPNLNDGSPLEYTLPAGSGKLFVRLYVTGP